MKEQWKRIPSLPSYFANEEGLIMRAPSVKPMPRGGYRFYGGQPTQGAWDGERFIYQYKRKTYKVAALICEAFHGARPIGMVCMHRDEDSRNNRQENLTWATQKENLNCPKFIAYCCSRTGERSPTAKYQKKMAKATI